MKCKFCQAELDEESTVCPVCGKDNEDAAAPAEEPVRESCCCEAQEPFEQEAPEAACGEEEDCEELEEAAEESGAAPKKNSPLAIALVAVGVIAVVAFLVALVLKGAGVIGGKDPYMVKGPDGQMVEATIAPDGKEGEVTQKGSYTVSDKQIVKVANEVVATCGEETLTNDQLQSLYWMQVYDFMNSYGQQAMAAGFDINVPLDMQVCGLEPGMTWQQYFLGASLSSWHLYQSLRFEGRKADHQLPPDMQTYLDGMEESLEKIAKENKFADAKDMLHHDMGAGATLEGYKTYMRSYYEGYSYYGELVKSIAPSAEEVEAYFDENAEDFKKNGIEKNDDLMVDVRHTLIQPVAEEGAEKNVYTDEAWAEAEKKAQSLLDEWVAGGKSEESFAVMADANTADGGSKGRGGLYQGVRKGQMTPAFDAWCFDGSRQPGDYGIVKTEYGYHIMYFVGSNPDWRLYAEQALKSQMLKDKLDGLKEAYPASFDYSKMALGFVDQAPENQK